MPLYINRTSCPQWRRFRLGLWHLDERIPLIGAIMVNISSHTIFDTERFILKGCMSLGGFVGVIFTLSLATDKNAEEQDFSLEWQSLP